jgi:site-specific DNA recombinase
VSKTTKRAVLYARFSSDLQKDRSIEDQFAVCRTVASRDNLKVTKTYSDRAKSGASMFERDALLEMMAAAKAKQFEVIIVESLDRLSRDQEDMAGLFKRLSFYGVEINTANEGTATTMHVGIRGIVSSLFLADLGAKVKRGQNGRVREGLMPGAVVYGYDRVLGKPGERVINKQEAETIRRIFREYASGASPKAIAAGLTRDNIPTPAGGKIWCKSVFTGGFLKRGLIGNRLFAGELVWNAFRKVRNPETGKMSQRVNPESEHIVVQVPHLRIIDQPLWETCQKLRRERAVAKFGPTGKVVRRNFVPHSDHLLAGLIRCGACGGHMRIHSGTRPGRSKRIACANAHARGTCTHKKGYDLDTITTGVIDGIRDRLLDPKLVAEAMKALHAQFEERNRKDSGDATAASKQLNRVQVQIDRLVDAISNSNAPVKALTVKLDALESERVSLAERLRLLEAESNVVRLHPAAIKTYCANMERLHGALSTGAEITAENRTAFRMVFDRIVVHPTGKCMPYEFTPYARIASVLGMNMAPDKRPATQILAEQGVGRSDGGASENAGAPTSLHDLVAMGRWRAAA